MKRDQRTGRSGIAAGGNWIIDQVKMIDVYPPQDALANIVAESRGNGGAPYNLLVDLHRLGAPFPLTGIGLVGDDENGRSIIEDCRGRGIDCEQVQRTDDAPTAYTDVMTVQSTGRRTFYHHRGANARLDVEHFAFANVKARILHLGYLLLLDRLDLPSATHGTRAAELLARARAIGLQTSVDVVSEESDRFAAVVLPALRHVDYCILNEFEAGRSTGRHVRSETGIDLDELRHAARELIAAGVRELVIIHWPEGALALDRDGHEWAMGSVAVPQSHIEGTAGAGDAFAAGLLYGLHEAKPLEECLRFAMCAAAASLFDPTTSGGIRSLAECLRLGEEFGHRPSPFAN